MFLQCFCCLVSPLIALRSWMERRFVIARLQINIADVSLKICCLFVFFFRCLVESLFCSLLRIYVCELSTRLHFRIFETPSRNSPFFFFSFLFAQFLAAFSAGKKGFVMNFEGSRDFNFVAPFSSIRVDDSQTQ